MRFRLTDGTIINTQKPDKHFSEYKVTEPLRYFNYSAYGPRARGKILRNPLLLKNYIQYLWGSFYASIFGAMLIHPDDDKRYSQALIDYLNALETSGQYTIHPYKVIRPSPNNKRLVVSGYAWNSGYAEPPTVLKTKQRTSRFVGMHSILYVRVNECKLPYRYDVEGLCERNGYFVLHLTTQDWEAIKNKMVKQADPFPPLKSKKEFAFV